MPLVLCIALGSALAGVARFAVSGFVGRHFGETFPWGTLIVNGTGSLVIGFFATVTDPTGRLPVGASARQFMMTGVLGGFTTYSSFSRQTLHLVSEGEWPQASANTAATLVLGFVAV